MVSYDSSYYKSLIFTVVGLVFDPGWYRNVTWADCGMVVLPTMYMYGGMNRENQTIYQKPQATFTPRQQEDNESFLLRFNGATSEPFFFYFLNTPYLANVGHGASTS